MFKGRHFDRSVILLCPRRYLAYNLSLRNLEEMMVERGISVGRAVSPPRRLSVVQSTCYISSLLRICDGTR